MVTLACEFADIETVMLLENLGADINFNENGEKGSNGLMLAAKKGKKDIIKFLHSKNERLINFQTEEGDSAVIFACENNDLETLKLLVELGADITVTDSLISDRPYSSYTGDNGLLIAVKHGYKKIIKFLHSQNDQLIHATGRCYNTALELACASI